MNHVIQCDDRIVRIAVDMKAFPHMSLEIIVCNAIRKAVNESNSEMSVGLVIVVNNPDIFFEMIRENLIETLQDKHVLYDYGLGKSNFTEVSLLIGGVSYVLGDAIKLKEIRRQYRAIEDSKAALDLRNDN